mmetsp:Transcript_55567/g.140628  ORF Transcript_55567/g.140628 Transcript_55567/m.140628 type:complete len:332 (-) Transcript_55567:82-1077(-)
MMMREIRQSMEMFIFCITPATWMYRMDPDFQGKFQWMYLNRWARIPFALMSIIASFSQFQVASAISQVSLAIIFAAGKLTDAIFNSLALTFIIELDEAFWKVVEINFNIEVIKDFRYKQKRPADKNEFGISTAGLGKGWSAIISRRALVSFILTLFYCRQVVSVLVIMDRHVLPTTLQLCDAWRLMKNCRIEDDCSFVEEYVMRPLIWAAIPFQDSIFEVATGNVNGTREHVECQSMEEQYNKSLIDNRHMFSNFSSALEHNVTGICHCEATMGFWHRSFWTKHLWGLLSRHHIVAGMGFSCAFFVVSFPSWLDFTVQKHEEKNQVAKRLE